MSSDVPLPQRHSTRLPFYDYSRAGAYFLTICALNRACLFGEIVDGVMTLSAAGHIAEQEWMQSGAMRRELVLDAFVVMPNHVHGIVFLNDADGVRNDGKDGETPSAAQTGASTSQAGTGVIAGGAGIHRPTGVHRTPLRTEGDRGREVPAGVHRTPLRTEGDHRGGAGVHRTPLRRPAGASIGAFVNGYKAAVTRSLLQMRIISGASAWQRNFYEHVIRNDADLDRIRRYIAENPTRWSSDQENPANLASHRS